MNDPEQVKSILRNMIREVSIEDTKGLEEQNEDMKFIIRKVFARYPDIIIDALNDKLALQGLPLETKESV